MKLIRLCLGSGLAMLSLVLGARAENFEGRVTMTVGEGKENQQITYAVKEDRMRVNMPGAGEGMGGMILDFKAKHILILLNMDGRKMYMKQPLKTAEAVAEAAQAVEVEPKATGRSETIAGYSADEYELVNKDKSVTHLWLGKGLGNFFSPSLMQGGGPFGGGKPKSADAWEKAVKKSGMFPLRVVTLNAKGKESSRMEVTQIEKTAIPESEFSTEGYSEFKMPGFGGGGLPGLGE